MMVSEAGASSGACALVLEERAGHVLTLRLNRPERLNALDVALGLALKESLERAAKDDAVRVVVLTGAGRGFFSGGALAMLRDARTRNAAHELADLLNAGKDITLAIATMPQPVLASVNGPAAGAGMNLALACDLRIASETATFGETFAQVGMFPDFGGTYFLPRLVGTARAAELFFSGAMILAAEAARLGIVNRVVPHERLEEETRAWAERLAAGPPLAMQAVKKCLVGAQYAELDRALDEELQQQIKCFASQDALEGFEAFFAKRKPNFTGR
jgi:2-(1,2-epoxy-1,2-dihydrophenyl)acetyl-CoA isomerase